MCRCATCMLSQLNYRASAYLNDGARAAAPYPFGAHSYYVPAQLFPTADGYLALFITHDAILAGLSPPRQVSTASRRWPSAGSEPRRGAGRRDRRAGHRHRRELGGDGCARSASRPRLSGRCPKRWRRHPRSSSSAGEFRLVGSRIHVDGYEPDYRSPAPAARSHPAPDEHGPHPAETHVSAQKSE